MTLSDLERRDAIEFLTNLHYYDRMVCLRVTKMGTVKQVGEKYSSGHHTPYQRSRPQSSQFFGTLRQNSLTPYGD